VSRGRPRLFDKTIPVHIEQAKIPVGAYWSRTDRVWFTFIEEGGKRKRRKLAGPEARLSDLHRLLEEFAGVERGTVGWLCDQFNASDKFKKLASNTQTDYLDQRKLVNTYQTKHGSLAKIRVSALSPPFIQRIIDKIAVEFPSKANHLLRYLRRVFSWGMLRGYCATNPAKGVEQAAERKLRRMPAPDVYLAVLEHARANYPVYLWVALELAFLCRLRGIETITLTDAHATPDGIHTNRRKGSRDTMVMWSPRLRSAWEAAIDERKRIWDKKHIPTPMQADKRLALVNMHGKPVSRQALSTIWQTLMIDMVEQGLITTEQRFGLHDSKRKGITETKGNRADKQDAGGHRTQAMVDVYDQSLPEVTTPRGV
jgi:site-specific recombinase XerC